MLKKMPNLNFKFSILYLVLRIKYLESNILLNPKFYYDVCDCTFEFILEAMLYYLCIFASIENELFSLFSNYCVDP